MFTSFRLAFLDMKFILVFTFFTCFCAEGAAPDWFNDYLSSNPTCEREYLCAVGEGETVGEALGMARLEIAKFFQTKIKSKSQVSTSSEQKGASVSSASFDEWTSKTMSEETSELISGLEIKKQEKVGIRTYVMVTLDRRKTAGLLKEKIEALDTEDAQLMDLNSRFVYPKILKNLALIEAFNERYALLSQFPLRIRVKKEHIQTKLNRLTPIKMSVVSNKQKLPAKLNHILVETFSPLKIVFVSQKAAPRYILKSEIMTEEQYLKVEGFKKLNVQFRLDLVNSKSQVVMGKLSAMSEQVARNSEQAIEKAIPDIKEELQNNLDQLTTIKFED